MNQKYAILLLHLNLFTQKLQLEEMKNNINFFNMYNQKILNELHTKYILYLIGDSNLKEIFVSAQMAGILHYIQDIFSLQSNYSLDIIIQKTHITNLDKYLVCGRNLEHEIMIANRYGMDSCYIGEQNYLNMITPTYHIQEVIDIHKVLKLR